MDTSVFIESIQRSLGAYAPLILAAVAVLALGWLVAVIARAAVFRGVHALGLNERVSGLLSQPLNLEKGLSVTVFWAVLFVAFFLFFNLFNMQGLANPFGILVTQIVGYLPHLLAGLVLTVVAWVLATVLKVVVNKVLSATTLDDKLSAHAGMAPMSQHPGSVLFWLVFLLFIPAILSAFQINGLLEPSQAMLTKLLNMLPNLLGALVIGVVGWLVARVLSALVTNLLAASGLDQLKKDAGIEYAIELSKLAGALVFVFVFVPALIAALDALKIEAISRPATEMLGKVLSAVPNIFAAAIILMVAYYLARFTSALVARLVHTMGVDELPAKVGMNSLFQHSTQPSSLVSGVIMLFAMLFAVVEAANQLHFVSVSHIISTFIRFGGDILLGGLILVIGFWLAGLVHKTLAPNSSAMAGVARLAILGLVIAMGLRAMGIADDIVNLAFALTFGAVAVAIALAFGLGGREAAGKQLEYWLSRWRKD